MHTIHWNYYLDLCAQLLGFKWCSLLKEKKNPPSLSIVCVCVFVCWVSIMTSQDKYHALPTCSKYAMVMRFRWHPIITIEISELWACVFLHREPLLKSSNHHYYKRDMQDWYVYMCQACTRGKVWMKHIWA